VLEARTTHAAPPAKDTATFWPARAIATRVAIALGDRDDDPHPGRLVRRAWNRNRLVELPRGPSA
jgi:hypothetical protein